MINDRPDGIEATPYAMRLILDDHGKTDCLTKRIHGDTLLKQRSANATGTLELRH
jgi:hypothetical protein